MKKWFAAFLGLVIFNSFIFGYNGILSGEGQLQIVKTKWFDIIYPPECEQTASVLVQNSDSLCEELYKEFDSEPYFRMPVVLTSGYESFNAYWTSYPYNHIVIYDTAIIPELAVFTETVLSVFKHELTHAITYNMKSDFFKTAGKIFGDAANPAPFLVTSGMAEGATVSIESKKGEGRLNDEFAMQNVKQAKIQNEFPDYFDVQTGTDLYPYGQYYYFNGAFNDWLQNKYGMKKYAQLWYTCVNFKALTFKNAFKKVYGVSLSSQWKAFIADYKVPENLAPDPVKANMAKDVFSSKITNESGRVFSSLSGNEKGFVYLDEETSTVFYISWNKFEKAEKGVKPEKLFTKNNLQEINSSIDGRFITYDYYSMAKSNVKKSVGIYDVENNSFFDVKETGVEEGFIIKKGDEYYFGCKTFSSQNYGITLYKIVENKKNRITGLQKLWSRYFDFEVALFNLTAAADDSGDFAFICKNGMNFTISIWDIEGNQKNNYDAPEKGMVFRDLSPVISDSQKNKFCFSYTKKGSLPRLGILDQKQFILLNEDISGGIYAPVVYEKTNGSKVIYSSHLYNQTKLLELEGEFDYVSLEAKKGDTLSARDVENDIELISQEYKAEKYSFTDGFYKGLLLPLCSLTSRSVAGDGYDEAIPYGVTYLTSNPWGSNTFMLQAGFSPEMKSGALQVDYSDGTATSLFNYSLSNYMEFDANGLKQTYGSLNLNSAIPFGNISYLKFGASQFDYYGHGGTVESDDYLYNITSGSAGFQSIYKAGPGRYEKAGIVFDTIFSYHYVEKLSSGKNNDYYDLGFKSIFYIPHLIPIECNRKFAYNFPLSITTSVFTGDSGNNLAPNGKMYYGATTLSDIFSYDAINVEAELILFGYEIQKAPSFCGLFYFGEFKIALNYYGGVSFDAENKYDSMHILQLPEIGKSIASGNMPWHNHFALNFQLGMTPTVLNVGKIMFVTSIIPDFEKKDCYFGLGFIANLL